MLCRAMAEIVGPSGPSQNVAKSPVLYSTVYIQYMRSLIVKGMLEMSKGVRAATQWGTSEDANVQMMGVIDA
jgi:hypothetical protein